MGVHGSTESFEFEVRRTAQRLAQQGIVLYIVDFIVIWLTRKHQRLGDLVAGTVVVRRSPQTAPIPARPS